ncbi:MAG: hypothetical protein LBL09_00525 [Oscillospiraceae bacterium]|jgi:hypothetical protein|nr:hypothetical protein [Oscillospiraceae bacterium]
MTEPKKKITKAQTGGGAVGAEQDNLNELVEIRLFKDGTRYKDDVFVAVNGKSFQIQRGVAVKVPRYIKNVLDQSMAQDEYTAALMQKHAGEFMGEAKKYLAD